MSDVALVLVAGLAAGAVNAVAGGGTLISFPALLAVGVPAVSANITSSVGLVTGYLGGVTGYRQELCGQRQRVRALALTAVTGGSLGAVALLVTPADAFRAIVPYLVLLACLLLGAQPWLARRVARGRSSPTPGSQDIGPAVRVGVFVAAMYGSYFGAGLGVLLLGVLGVLLVDSLQRLNGLKTVLALLVNAVGVLVFLFSDEVVWLFAALLLVSSYLGGLVGARIARLLPPTVLRTAIIVFGVAVAILLVVKG